MNQKKLKIIILTCSVLLIFILFFFIKPAFIGWFATQLTIINSDPVIQPIGDHTINATELWTFQVNATDIDQNPLTYADNTSLFNISNSTGLINFTPTIAQIGVYSIMITVTDGKGGSANDTFTLTIIVAPSPPTPPLFGGGQGGGTGAASIIVTIANLDLVQKITRVLMINQTVVFINKRKVNTLTLKKLDEANKKATVTLELILKTYILDEGQTIEVDSDGNGLKDLALTLDKLVTPSAQITFEKIYEMQPAVSVPTVELPTPSTKEELFFLIESSPLKQIQLLLLLIISIIIILILHKKKKKKMCKRNKTKAVRKS